jgi:hypothetical protein
MQKKKKFDNDKYFLFAAFKGIKELVTDHL